MKKEAKAWTVRDLRNRFTSIDFPDYQREPNVRARGAKQRLIDSMIREFDIASLYFYVDDKGSFECVDGRQRIGAIMSFIGENKHDIDNGFEFANENEIFRDKKFEFDALQEKSFAQIEALAANGRAKEKAQAKRFTKRLLDYRIAVIELSGSSSEQEFSLQFTRLNLGTIINSGEKLHAMIGELRNECFADKKIGHHPFLEGSRLSIRRFSREQVAAQILVQIFSLESPKKEFTRLRHIDLQISFKDNVRLNGDQKKWIKRVSTTMTLLKNAFDDLGILRNRAITVSTVLLAWKLKIASKTEAAKLTDFMVEFLNRLAWQVGKGIGAPEEYRYLNDFQRHVTQASVEKPAVEERHRILAKQHGIWSRSKILEGDREYRRKNPGSDPSRLSREVQ